MVLKVEIHQISNLLHNPNSLETKQGASLFFWPSETKNTQELTFLLNLQIIYYLIILMAIKIYEVNIFFF